ncbi:putative membrane protein [Bacteroides fragilis str. 2-F-2 |uniref:Putative membrane protein n=1 Tax=Bacteroides fragilis str. 2-F-2 \|nr:putative membrane protein [Bacteroides fragilis str. 2-F-2 \
MYVIIFFYCFFVSFFCFYCFFCLFSFFRATGSGEAASLLP